MASQFADRARQEAKLKKKKAAKAATLANKCAQASKVQTEATEFLVSVSR
jgi:hypothetical protein